MNFGRKFKNLFKSGQDKLKTKLADVFASKQNIEENTNNNNKVIVKESNSDKKEEKINSPKNENFKNFLKIEEDENDFIYHLDEDEETEEENNSKLSKTL